MVEETLESNIYAYEKGVPSLSRTLQALGQLGPPPLPSYCLKKPRVANILTFIPKPFQVERCTEAGTSSNCVLTFALTRASVLKWTDRWISSKYICHVTRLRRLYARYTSKNKLKNEKTVSVLGRSPGEQLMAVSWQENGGLFHFVLIIGIQRTSDVEKVQKSPVGVRRLTDLLSYRTSQTPFSHWSFHDT